MKNNLESYKVAFADKLQKDVTGKGLIARNSDGMYIAYLSNKRVITANHLKELAEKIEYYSKKPVMPIPNYSQLLNMSRPHFI